MLDEAQDVEKVEGGLERPGGQDLNNLGASMLELGRQGGKLCSMQRELKQEEG